VAFVNTFFEKRVEQLFDLARRVEEAFASAGLEYRVIGGLATYLYVEEVAPDAGRLTKDIDKPYGARIWTALRKPSSHSA
jgi:hypothetical protein